jgi:hypothetical protein
LVSNILEWEREKFWEHPILEEKQKKQRNKENDGQIKRRLEIGKG